MHLDFGMHSSRGGYGTPRKDNREEDVIQDSGGGDYAPNIENTPRKSD